MNDLPQQADVVFVGAAHAALVAAADLLDAGRSTVLLDQVEHPGGWVQTAELGAPGFHHDRYLEHQLWLLREVPVMADEVRRQKDQEDLAAAAEARARAAWHRSEAERTAASLPELVQEATADYFRARDDARAVEAGPGRFGRKTAKVEAAQARWAEAAQRWDDSQLPASGWPDNSVRVAARSAAERAVASTVRHHSTGAEREDHAAATLERRVSDRERDQQAAITTNKRHRAQREAVVAAAERDRARIAYYRQVRAERAEAMAPEEIARAD